MGLLNLKVKKIKPKFFIKPNPGFQLYFAGGFNKKFEEDLKTKGANRLASQLLDRKTVDEWIQGRKEGKCRGHLFLDSGAFSAHTQGIELDVDKYIEYINSIDEHLSIFAQVDKIPGEFRKPKTREQLIGAPMESWENYLSMVHKVKSRDKLLPIFHQGEDYRWLRKMLEYRHEDGTPIKYIGISPANDVTVNEKIEFIDKCFTIIAMSSNPTVKTHAFGMTSLKVLEMYPFTSADSTTWIMTGANGNIMTKFGSVLVSSKTMKNREHLIHMPKAAQQEIQNYVESKGYDMQQLAEDYVQRIKFNIDYLLDWSINYQYKPSLIRRRPLF